MAPENKSMPGIELDGLNASHMLSLLIIMTIMYSSLCFPNTYDMYNMPVCVYVHIPVCKCTLF